MRTSEGSLVESPINDNSTTFGSPLSQSATSTSAVDYIPSETSAVSDHGSSMIQQFSYQISHESGNVPTTFGGRTLEESAGRNETVPDRSPTFDGSSILDHSAAVEFSSLSQKPTTSGLSDQYSAKSSTMALPNVSGSSFVSSPHSQGIMYPPTVGVMNLNPQPHSARATGTLVPSNFYPFGLELTDFSNGQNALVPRHGS